MLGVIDAEVTMKLSHLNRKGTMVTAAKTATMNAAGTPTSRIDSHRRGGAGGRIPGGGPGDTWGVGGAQPDGPRPGITGPDGPPGALCVILSPTPVP